MREYQKSQAVRLLDIAALGPFLIWASRQQRLPAGARTLLALAGVATIIYNARNYLRNVQEE